MPSGAPAARPSTTPPGREAAAAAAGFVLTPARLRRAVVAGRRLPAFGLTGGLTGPLSSTFPPDADRKILRSSRLLARLLARVSSDDQAMTSSPRLLEQLAIDLRNRLARSWTYATVTAWRAREPAFAGLVTAADVLDWVTDFDRPPAERRRELGALLGWAADERPAAEVVFAACLPGLGRAAAELSRAWRVDGVEVDQAVVAAGWERLVRLAGRRLPWPDRAIVSGARTAARDELRAAARRRARETVTAGAPDTGLANDGSFTTAAELIAAAVDSGALGLESARLVWATRVLGIRPGELAGGSAAALDAVLARRARAERALRRHLSLERGEVA